MKIFNGAVPHRPLPAEAGTPYPTALFDYEISGLGRLRSRGCPRYSRTIPLDKVCVPGLPSSDSLHECWVAIAARSQFAPRPRRAPRRESLSLDGSNRGGIRLSGMGRPRGVH